MTNIVIVDAVRTPIGKRNGGLSTLHPAQVLGTVQKATRRPHRHRPGRGRSGRRWLRQPGRRAERSTSTRTAWLAAGCRCRSPPPPSTPSAARPSRPPTSVAHALVGSGVVDVAIACGVETMSRCRSGRWLQEPGLGMPPEDLLLSSTRATTQFEGAERIADEVGHHPRRRRRVRPPFAAAAPRRPGPRTASRPDRHRRGARPFDEDGNPRRHDPPRRPRRGPARDHDREARQTEAGRPETACTPPARRSQISDGAAALLLDDREKARHRSAFGPGPASSTRAWSAAIRCSCSPVRSTPLACMLGRTGLSIDDIDVFEINEAFASVVLAWEKESRRRHEQGQPQRRRDRRSATRSAAPAASCSPRPCTSSSAPAAATPW
jgi:acetyl-CoA C-acetyltransferase